MTANTVSNIILMPKQDVKILLYTSKQMMEKELFAQSSAKIKVQYSRDSIQNLYTYLIGIFALTLSIGVSTYYTMRTDKIRRRKLSDKLNNKISEIEQELIKVKEKNTNINKMHDDINNKIIALEKSNTQQRIFYRLRVKDLSKELNFWKDTIRKLMYVSEDKTISPEIIISTVTKELKTFTVLEKSNDDIDEIFYIADQIVKGGNIE